MAGTGKLTDAELLSLIQQTTRGLQHQENASDNPDVTETLPVLKTETRKIAVDFEKKGEKESIAESGKHAQLLYKSLACTSVKPEDKQAINLETTYSQQEGNFSDTANTVSQSSAIPSDQTVSLAEMISEVKEVTQSDAVLDGTKSQSNETSQMKDALSQGNVLSQVKNVDQSVISSSPLDEVSQTYVTLSVEEKSQPCVTSSLKKMPQSYSNSLSKDISQACVKSLSNEISQTSVSSYAQQITDTAALSTGTSGSRVDVTLPSYQIDAELVAMLSKEEITNLVHEYRTELEETKKKLERSERQLRKANDYNNMLRNMVEKLSGEIHRVKHAKTCSVHVQVDKEDFLEYTTGRSTMPNWQVDDDHNSVPMDISQTEETVVVSDNTSSQQQTSVETGSFSVADSVKQAAEAVVQKQQADMLHDSGYTYDPSSGLYYHAASGYYYDQEKSLFYDPKTGIYYYYDYGMGEYVFHSQIELPSQTQAEQSTVKVDIPFRRKRSDTKESTKTPKTNKGRERQSSEEKVYKNRKERRRAEQEKRFIQRRQSIDKIDRRGRKRRRYNSYSSDSSRSRSRSYSYDRGRRNSAPYEKDNTRQDEHSGSMRRQDRRNRKTEEGNPSRKNNVGLEVASDESDLQIIEDRLTEKGKKMAKARRKTADDFDTRTKTKRSDVTTRRSKSEEQVISSIAEDGELEDSDCEGTEHKVDFVTVNSDDDYELESEKELMIVIDELSANENEGIDREKSEENKNVSENVAKENTMKYEMDSKHQSTDADNQSNKFEKEIFHKSRFKGHTDSDNKKGKEKSIKGNKEIGECQSETESGELTDTESENSSFSKSYSSCSIVSDEEDVYIDLVEQDEQEETEVAGSYPPCIRVMVLESDCLAVGSLYIVTCTGAKIGRENCDICIPDLNVSKVQAEICYDENTNVYQIFDHASQNGTYLNNQRLSPAKIASEAFVVSHGDCVDICTTKLLCHIHPGSDTCDQCEPGVVIAMHKAQKPQTELKVLSKEERLQQKKQELNQIKKKYGLKNSAYENNPRVFNNPNYTDKAEERRKKVGSDVPGQKTEVPASVHKPISTGNVGHKLLQKMGWKEGESLGKNNTGIQEPISVTLRASQKAGLGSASAASFSAEDANSVHVKKATRRIQAQQRYRQLETEKSGSVEKTWTKGDTEFIE